MSYNILECMLNLKLLLHKQLTGFTLVAHMLSPNSKCAVPDKDLAVEYELEKIENSQNGKVKNRTSTQLSIVQHYSRVFA